MIFPSLAQLATREVITLDASQPLKEAVHLMNVHHIRDIIVTQGQTYFILTARELVDFQIRQIPLTTALSDLQLNVVPQMLPTDSVMKALMVIQNHPDNHVCLINEDKEIIGIVSYSDLAASLQPDQLVQSQQVGDIVRDGYLLQVDKMESLQAVFGKLHQHNETAAIVIDQQQPVGIMTQTQVIGLLDEDQNWQKPVADYMSAPLITVHATASIQYALAISREHHIKHIVVTEGAEVIGVLHQKSLVSLVYQTLYERYENENKKLKQEMDLLKAGPVVSLIWKMAPDWPVKYVTPNLTKVLGYQHSEWLSPHFKFSDVIHPDDLDRVTQEVIGHIENQQPYWEQRYRLLSKQGKWLWIYDYSQPIYDENNQVKEIFGYLLDQTHLIETEQALQQNELQYRSLFEFYPLATVLIDPDTLLPIRFNKQAYQQLGYSAEVFSNLRIADYEVIESEQKVRKRIEAILAGETLRFETKHRHQSGKLLDIDVTVRPLEIEDQTFLLAVFEDITKFKQSQTALTKTHQQLQQASEEKSKFMAYLSHEIRTPLSGIIGLCDLAQSEVDMGALKQTTVQVKEAAQHLMSLMNDLLDLSKMEANKLSLSLQASSLSSLAEEVMVLANGIQRPHTVALALEIDPKIPQWLEFDGQRLRQVLINLLSNAIKFTEQGQVRLEITVVRCESEQAWIKFSVTDTGVGIAEANLERLFQPYHQLESNSNLHGGTGLGLSISQQLVQLMHGKGIEVRSQPGQGSCFAFELPLAVAESNEDQSISDLKSTRLVYQLTGQLLVAEDDPINQQVVQQQLSVLGITDAVFVKDGAQALQAVEQQPFDLVIMDMHMPVMGGLEASQKLHDLHPDWPIIALSAANSEQDRQLAEAAGIKQYLTKPVDIQTLYSVLSAFLTKQTAQVDLMAMQFSPDHHEIQTEPQQQLSDSLLQSKLIDRQRGIQQLNGHQNLYIKLLNQFLDQLNQEYDALAKALETAAKYTASPAELTRLQAQNHGMKGVAANLALTALYEISQQVDRQLKQQLAPTKQMAQTFNQVLVDTRQAIQDQLANLPKQTVTTDLQEAKTVSQKLSDAELINALQQLLSDLQSQRFLEVEQLQPLLASLSTNLQETYGKSLIEAIDNLEFDQAIQSVNHLLSKLVEGGE